MIHFVVALRAEAGPIIERFGLRGEAHRAPFAFYQGKDARLVVSGVGRVAAAGATAYLATRCPEPRAAWLNLGTAAHRTFDLGEAVIADQIIEAASGRSWYPPLIGAGDLRSASVCTVDRIETDLTDQHLYEMEAAGFYSTVVRWSSTELVRVLKVVSDRGEESLRPFDRDRVAGLIEGVLEAVDSEVESLRELATRLPHPSGEGFDVLGERWRFSFTQRRRLQRQAVRAAALGREVDSLELGGCSSAAAVLDQIDRQLDGTPFPRP